MQSIAPQSEEHAEVRGLLELIAGTSLPLVSEFVGVLNLESREISIHDANQGRHFSGQISENGRVIVLRQKSHARPIHLIDEATLQEMI